VNTKLASFVAIISLNIFIVTNVFANVYDSLPENTRAGVVSELEFASGLETSGSQKLELQIQPEVQIDISDNLQLTALFRFRADAQDEINPRDQSKAELRELYIETDWRETLFTIGKQQIVWGKADGLKVLDIVNPQNFQEFILDDFDDSRIPVWSINAEIPFDETVIQFIVIPDQTYNKFAQRGALYSFTSPLVSPTIPTGTTVVMEPVKEPDQVVQDADVAMRVSSFINGWDVTFNYLYHFYDTPVFFREIDFSMASPVVTLKPEYKRSHLLGGSFSNAFGSLTLRGELAYSFNRFYSISDITDADADGVLQSDEFAYVLGFDWQGIEDSFLSLQLFQTYVLKDNPDLIRDQLDTTLTFLYRQTFYNETLSIETLLLHNINNDDGLLRPKITYQLRDDTNIWLGVDIFYGNSNGLFGQFDETDRLVAGIEWSL